MKSYSLVTDNRHLAHALLCSGWPYVTVHHMLPDSMILYLHFTVNTIAQVKPEKAQKVEGMLIQMAQTGQLGGKVLA